MLAATAPTVPFPTDTREDIHDCITTRSRTQAAGDREVLASHLGISPHQLSYVTHSGSGEGLLFYGDTAIPFVDRFPKDTELYTLLTTKPEDKANERKDE